MNTLYYNTFTSCGTVALIIRLVQVMVLALGQFSDICRPQGYGFHPIKNFRNCAVKMLHRFFANFCHEIGCENDQTYIFRFVKYLSTFFYAYLLIFISSSLLQQVSILTDPAYFVSPSCHCGILALSRLWKRLSPLAIYSAITKYRGGAIVCIVLGK